MRNNLSYFLVGLVLMVGVSTPVFGADFYAGKTLRLIVGFSPGGGYDTYTRAIARHIGKYIPGNPTPVVMNMTGAGSLIAANYNANKAKPDGLTMAVWTPGIILGHALGDKKVKFDPRDLGWIGTPTTETIACGMRGVAGLKTLDDIVKSGRTLIVPGTRAPGNTTDPPKFLNRALGTKFKVVTGYRGTARIRLAMQSREAQAACWTWESMRVTARGMLDAEGDDKFIPFIIAKEWNDPEVRGLPLFNEVIKDNSTLTLWKAFNAQNEITKAYSVAPGTPKDRLNILRKAFAATMKDPQFLADAKKSKLNVTYVTWQQVEKGIQEIQSLPANLKEELQVMAGLKKKR